MRVLVIFISCIAIVGCNQPPDQNSQKPNTFVNVDSLTAVFAASWNNKDSAAAVNIVADNAVVMYDTVMHNGIREITNNWITGGLKVISNIKTASAVKGSNESLAYDGGTYNLTLTIPGGPVLTEKGNYSFVWTKTIKDEWKLTLIHLEEVSRMPDLE